MPVHSIKPSLLKKIVSDFAHFTFQQGDGFEWQPATKIIVYENTENTLPLLLHEISHAVLSHETYSLDTDLLHKENAAWQYALCVLSPIYGIKVGQELVEECLDDYRTWLYKRSLCPACGQTGLQTKKKAYACINCGCSWKVNDARRCALRRFKVTGGN